MRIDKKIRRLKALRLTAFRLKTLLLKVPQLEQLPFFKILAALPLLFSFSQASAKDYEQRLESESDEAFAKRVICNTCLIHTGINKHPGVLEISFPQKNTLLVIFEHDYDEDRGDNIGFLGAPGAETNVSPILLIPTDDATLYQKFILPPLGINGGSPLVSSVFYANADNDKEKELFIMVEWSIFHRGSADGTMYGVEVYDATLTTKPPPPAYNVTRIRELGLKFGGFEGESMGKPVTAKYKTASDVKAGIKAMKDAK